MSASTISPDGSPLKKAINAQESKTLSVILFLLLLSFYFREGFHYGQMFVFSSQTANKPRCHRFDQDALRRSFDVGMCPNFNFKLFPQTPGYDDLPFNRKVNRFWLC